MDQSPIVSTPRLPKNQNSGNKGENKFTVASFACPLDIHARHHYTHTYKKSATIIPPQSPNHKVSKKRTFCSADIISLENVSLIPFGYRMDFDLAEFHDRHRDEIIREWVRLLHTEVSENYSRRSIDELTGTVTGAFLADYHVMIHDDYTYLDRFIEKITRMRLGAGFALSDVQKAFEFYRKIVVPILAKETKIEEFQRSISKINTCLAYTIHRFSDLFQKMHENK